MKTAAVLVGALLLLASGARAQTSAANFENASLQGLSWHPTASPEPTITASLLPSEFASPDPVASASPNWASLPAAMPAAVPAEPPQGVEGVFPNRNWQAYLGYTFFRFYEVPNQTVNENGFNGSVAYYLRDWIAADGELFAAFGSQGGTITSSRNGCRRPSAPLANARRAGIVGARACGRIAFHSADGLWLRECVRFRAGWRR